MTIGITADTIRVAIGPTMITTGMMAMIEASRIAMNMTDALRKGSEHGADRLSGSQGGSGGILGKRTEVEGRQTGDSLENSQ